jgi:hypothetical protein
MKIILFIFIFSGIFLSAGSVLAVNTCRSNITLCANGAQNAETYLTSATATQSAEYCLLMANRLKMHCGYTGPVTVAYSVDGRIQRIVGYGGKNNLASPALPPLNATPPTTTTTSTTTTTLPKPPILNYGATIFTFVRGTAIPTMVPVNTGGAITSCAKSPTSLALPAGLTISSNCTISGIPTIKSTATLYTIRATGPGGFGDRALTITVNDPVVKPNFKYNGLPLTWTQNVQITPVTPVNTGGAITSCVRLSTSPAFPTGIVLSSTCVLTGKPTVAATMKTYLIRGSNAGGSFDYSFQFVVNAPLLAPDLYYEDNPNRLTVGTAAAIVPRNNGGAYTSCTFLSTNPALPAGLSFNSTNCSIIGTPTVVNSTAVTYQIRATNATGSKDSPVSILVQPVGPVPTTIVYPGNPYTLTQGASASIWPNISGAVTSCTRASNSPLLPAGLSINSTTCAITGIPTVTSSATVYTIQAQATTGPITANVTITVGAGATLPPNLSYPGSPYVWMQSQSIGTITPTSTGGVVTACSMSPTSPALPSGISLSSNCALSGTPTAPSPNQSYSVRATNGGGTGDFGLIIRVNELMPLPNISYGGPWALMTQQYVQLQATNTGGAVSSCSMSPTSPALPPGMNLDGIYCTIFGTPTTVTPMTTYRIRAANTAGLSESSVSFQTMSPVVAPNISYPGAGNLTFTVGVAITPVVVTNTGGAITSCARGNFSPNFPGGLTLNSNCTLSGTPISSAPMSMYTVRATNSAGSSDAIMQFQVLSGAPAIQYAGSYAWRVGIAITPVYPSNAGGAITSCALSPNSPAPTAALGSIDINPTTCAISGTPSGVQATTTYIIRAQNSSGYSDAPITISISP